MKSVLLVLMLVFTAQAWSVTAYNCDITVVEKNSNETWDWTKKVFLSTEFRNKVTFNETTLELYLDRNEMIRGSVNGQPNFKLDGNAYNGSFESAYHTGTITCEKLQKLSHLFRFNSWDQFFTLDKKIGAGHIQNSMQVSSLKYKQICFIGDINEAAKAASAEMKIKGVIKSQYEIAYTWQDTTCARGQGTSVDDWTCYEYKTETRTDSIRHCFESEYDRP